MREIQIEYPDKTMHRIVVSDYNHSKDTDLDYINYYDLATNRNMYSILKEEDGKIFNDTNLYDFTYNDLVRNIERKDVSNLPSTITCYLENEQFLYQEPEQLEEQKSVQKFNVYHITETNRYYVETEICETYKVGTGIYFLNGIKCKQVTENEIKEIEEKSLNHNPSLEAEIKNTSFSSEKVSFEVYNINDKILVKDNICNKYNIGKGYHYINNNLFKEIPEEELEKLKNVEHLNPEYKSLLFEKDINQINVYVDNDTNRMYVKDSLGIGFGIFYIGNNRCKEVKPEDIENYDVEYLIMNFNAKKEEKNELVIVYKDKNNDNKLYITKENCKKYNIGNFNNFKYINNQECYEISLEELSMLNESEHDDTKVNTKVSTVYLQKEVQQVINKKVEEKNDQIEETFLVCKYQDLYFIDSEIAIRHGIVCRNEVSVEGRIFTEVSEEDIKMIEDSTKDSYIKMVRREVNIEENTKEEESTKTL